MPIRQSVCLPLFAPKDADLPRLQALFEQIKAIGLEAVETWARPANFPQIVQWAGEAGLSIASFVGHSPAPGGLIDRTQHDRIESQLRESIDIAVETSTPGVIVFSGNRIEGLSDSDAIEIAAEGLARVCPYAQQRGVNLNLELLNSKVNHPGYACDHTAWGLAVCRAVASPRVKLLYDIYHMQIMEGDIIRTIREHIEHIGHFHTAGNPGRFLMDDDQELNYRGICRAIAQSGYDGYVGHEFVPRSPRPLDELKTAIVFILADDLGYGDLGCYGAKPEHVQTPNIDSIARRGIRFTDCHSPSSVCTPSRYNFMTGRYCWRTWAQTGCIWANDPCVIEPNRPTIASVLRDGGYYTGMVGKWHLGFGSAEDVHWDRYRGPDWNRPLTRGPTSCGFDSFSGIPAVGQLPHLFIHDNMVCDLESGDPIRLVPDPRPQYMVDYLDRPRDSNWDLRTQGGKKATYLSQDLADQLTRQAVAFIDKPHDKPFFLYFAHRNVHAPLDPHPRFRGTSGIGTYGDFIHELDASVGQVMAALDRNGLTDNTIVIFASDNGATQHHQPVQRVNYDGHMSNGPLRGSKTEVYEGGHRIPLIARWPGHIPAGACCDQLIALTDMLRSCAALAGVPVPDGASPDGLDLSASLLQGNQARPARQTLIHDSFLVVTYAIRHQDWKLIVGPSGGGLIALHGKPAAGPGQLYNLRDDLAEENNLYRQRPEIVNDLVDRMLAIRQTT